MSIPRFALYVAVFLGTVLPASAQSVRSVPRAVAPPAAPAEVLFPCQPDARTMCLNQGRFRVTASFDVSTTLFGDGHPIALTDATGYIWFFSADNVELIVKVLDGCPVNGHYWVFAGGMTNVDFCLRVADTQTEGFTLYCNHPNTPFQPIQDTSAFPTCP